MKRTNNTARRVSTVLSIFLMLVFAKGCLKMAYRTGKMNNFGIPPTTETVTNNRAARVNIETTNLTRYHLDGTDFTRFCSTATVTNTNPDLYPAQEYLVCSDDPKDDLWHIRYDATGTDPIVSLRVSDSSVIPNTFVTPDMLDEYSEQVQLATSSSQQRETD